MKFFILYLFLFSLCIQCAKLKVSEDEKKQNFWRENSRKTLYESLKLKKNENIAKNVILFLGDGMGMPTVTAMRIYKGQKSNKSGESEFLTFDKFPYVSLSKTYAVDTQLSDSANTATAYLGGVKGNYATAGVDGRVIHENCSSSLDPDTHVSSILQWAQDQGKWTGFVTTTRVTHATPSGLYAHIASRDWESWTPDSRCLDIAQQLIHQEPGKSARVILGGGRMHFIPNSESDIDGDPGNRSDSRNLLKEWETLRKTKNVSYKAVFDAQELRKVNPEKVDYLLGLFHSNHIPYVADKPYLNKEYPDLVEMTEIAIKILSRSPKGFFLLVEGGKIDSAHHMNWGMKALEEGVEFDKAIQKGQEMVDEKDTLIVVTADHSHGLTIGGNYPLRGTNIIGLGGVSNVDNLTMTILGYISGPGYKKNSRDRNLTEEEAVKKDFQQDALLPMKEANHGSEDVAVYSRGPMAHLFHGVHEQSYIAYAMAYASCIGENREHCNSSGSLTTNYSIISIFKIVFVAIWTYFIGNNLL